MQLVNGQRISLSELGAGSLRVSSGHPMIAVSMQGGHAEEACGPGNPSIQGASWDGAGLSIDIGRLPAQVSELQLVTQEGSSLQVGNSRLSLSGGPRTCGKVYRHSSGWKFAAMDERYSGAFGGMAEQAFKPSRTAPPTNPPKTAGTSNPPTSGPIRLQKLTLEKGNSAPLSLAKDGGLSGIIHANLNWQQKRGFFSQAADLDLGCFWQMKDGEKGMVQAIGGNFGSQHHAPYITLDHDDRSGASAQGENLRIWRPDLLQRAIVVAFIYDGVANFRDVGANLTLRDPSGNELRLNLSNPQAGRSFCAIATIVNDGQRLVIKNEELYFSGHRECDHHYGLGFQWTAGRKD